MSSLVIDFRYLDDFERSAGRAKETLDRRMEDYSDVSRRVGTVATRRSNLGQCTYYLRKKNEKLTEKAQQLTGFQTQVHTFVTDAQEADRRVATHVRTSTDTFRAATGIGVAPSGVIAWIEEKLVALYDRIETRMSNFVEGVRSSWEAVKAFYERHKYIIDLVVDVALTAAAFIALAAAATATGGAALAVVAAGFTLFNASMELSGSTAALVCHLGGNDEAADQCAQFNGREAFKAVGRGADAVAGFFGKEPHMEQWASGVYTGLTIAASVYSIGKTGKEIYKCFDFTKSGTGLKRAKSWAEAGKEAFGLGSKNDASSATGAAKAKAVAKHLRTSERTANYIITGGNYVKNTIKITKDIDSVVKSGYLKMTDAALSYVKLTGPGDDIADAAEEAVDTWGVIFGGA